MEHSWKAYLQVNIPEVNSYTTNTRTILEFHREDPNNVLIFIIQCNIGITGPLISPMVVRSQRVSWTVLQLEGFLVTCNTCTSECFKECCLLQIFPRRVVFKYILPVTDA